MTRVAAVDCGTNSIRLLVADADPATGELVELDRRMTIVRLGQGVDRTGRLAPEALERTFAACREYAEVIKAHGAEKIRFVATSASRDAENRDDFVRGVMDILGVEPEVITGDQEAEFSFTGATKELTGRADLDRPYLVVDIGGGSTEFVVGEDTVAGRALRGHRLRPDDGAPPRGRGRRRSPTRRRPAQIDGDPRRHRRGPRPGDADRPADRARTLVGLAGSVTTVAALALGLTAYDSAAIHHSRISYERVARAHGLAADVHPRPSAP